MSELDTDYSASPDGPSLREGLPPAYRMRADSHYVENLDADLFAPPIRFLDADTIDTTGDEPSPASDFVESVRQHGVLQPLLVRGRGGRYGLIAGRKRLAAAMAAGMQRVPCVVQRVDDDEASQLALATNLSAAGGTHSTPPDIRKERPVDGLTDELSRSLTALVSSVNLLSDGSSLSQPLATDLVKAEAARALQLVWALREITDEARLHRSRIEIADLVDGARDRFLPEQRLRRLNLSVARHEGNTAVNGDRDLLTRAIVGLMSAGASLPHADAGGRVTVRVVVEPEDLVVVEVSRDGLSVPDDWVATAFEYPWPVGAGLATLAFLRAARHVAERHGGVLRMATSAAGTTLSIALPVA